MAMGEWGSLALGKTPPGYRFLEFYFIRSLSPEVISLRAYDFARELTDVTLLVCCASSLDFSCCSLSNKSANPNKTFVNPRRAFDDNEMLNGLAWLRSVFAGHLRDLAEGTDFVVFADPLRGPFGKTDCDPIR